MKKLKILSWNVNGLRAVYRKGFLDFVKKENPDILLLQETKARPDQLPDKLKEIKNYHVFFSSAQRKGYSGVALYSKFEPQNVKTGFGIERFDREGRTLIVDYGKFLLFNVYFPNGKASEKRLRYKMDFYKAFLDYVSDLVKEGRKIVIGGDVNTAHQEIDLARPKPNAKFSGFLPQERAWIDQLLKRGFIDTFRIFNQSGGHYTWWSQITKARERNVGWRIDYFFVSKNLKKRVKSAFILPEVMGSDHCPIGIEMKI